MAKTTVTADAIEKLAIKLMKEFEADGEPVTKEEALEMAEMEIKAKGIKNYVQSTPEKKSTKKREIKLDAEKVKIIEILASYLKENEEMGDFVENIKENGVIHPVIVRPKEDGTYGWTKGLPSRHMFYSAFQDIKNEIGNIVDVEIRKTVGDLY